MAPSVYRPRAADRPTAELAGEQLVLDEATGRLIHLNQTATLIWRLCDGRRTVDELCALLRAAYPERADQVDADARRAVEELRASGALDDRG